MAATAQMIVQAKVTELGNDMELRSKFTDGETPTNAVRIYAVIGSTEVNLSVHTGVAHSLVAGCFVKAAVSNVYAAAVSATGLVSLGVLTYMEQGECMYLPVSSLTVSIPMALVGAGATAAIEALVYER